MLTVIAALRVKTAMIFIMKNSRLSVPVGKSARFRPSGAARLGLKRYQGCDTSGLAMIPW
jgi:hypothetical protein